MPIFLEKSRNNGFFIYKKTLDNKGVFFEQALDNISSEVEAPLSEGVHMMEPPIIHDMNLYDSNARDIDSETYPGNENKGTKFIGPERNLKLSDSDSEFGSSSDQRSNESDSMILTRSKAQGSLTGAAEVTAAPKAYYRAKGQDSTYSISVSLDEVARESAKDSTQDSPPKDNDDEDIDSINKKKMKMETSQLKQDFLFEGDHDEGIFERVSSKHDQRQQYLEEHIIAESWHDHEKRLEEEEILRQNCLISDEVTVNGPSRLAEAKESAGPSGPHILKFRNAHETNSGPSGPNFLQTSPNNYSGSSRNYGKNSLHPELLGLHLGNIPPTRYADETRVVKVEPGCWTSLNTSVQPGDILLGFFFTKKNFIYLIFFV